MKNQLPLRTGYCDSDHGNDVNDRVSITGYAVFINNNLVSWSSKKQDKVATSSTEAEYYAVNEIRKELLWCSQLLNEMGFQIKFPIIIYCDNLSAIKIAENDVDHGRSKHIDIVYHAIRDDIKNKMIEIKWVSTEHQLADIFTKSLGTNVFTRLRDQLIKTF